MSQYVFTMTSRMVAITVTCLVLLCVLLFVMGVEIGRLLGPTRAAVSTAPAIAPPAPAAPAPTPAPVAAPAPSASTP